MSEIQPSQSISRRGKIHFGVIRLVTVLALGMPLGVIAAYYLFGWQAAVIAFPFLLYSVFFGARRARQGPHKPKIWRVLVFLAFWAIPAASIIFGHPEIMRIWAYAMAIPFALSLGMDKDTAQTFTAKRFNVAARWTRAFHLAIWMLIAGLFVAGSELIWFRASLGGWIWYHAFGVPIFMALMVAVYEVLERIVRPKPKQTIYRVDPPPPTPGEVSNSFEAFSRWPSLNLKLAYGSLSVSQAQAIASNPDWACEKLLEMAGNQLNRPPRPEFIAAFMGSAITLRPDGDATTHVEWHFSEAPKGMQVMGRVHAFRAQNVPVGLIPQLIAAAWEDDWEQLDVVASPYIYFNKTA